MAATSPILILALAAPALLSTAQSGPPRVPTDVALKQLIKRVDPVVLPEAIALKVGGPVIADIIVSPKGTVESVHILAGPPILQAAATEAFKQWVFKPFMRNGRAVPALVLVEVQFPDPVADAQRRAAQVSAEVMRAYLRGVNACDRDLESSLKTADRTCGEVVRLANQHETLQPMRAIAHGKYGESLLRQWRFQDALVEFEHALKLQLAATGPNTYDASAAYAMIGMLHENLRNPVMADESFAQAIKSYDAAVSADPSRAGTHTANFEPLIRRYAALKRTMGQESAATALEAKAAALPAAPPPPAPPAPPGPVAAKTVGSIVCFGPFGTRLTEDDIRQIRAALPKDARPWFIVGEDPWLQREAVRVIRLTIYLETDTVGTSMRRGRIFWAQAQLPAPGAFNARKTWEQVGLAPVEFVQVPPFVTDPIAAWTPLSTRPFTVGSFDQSQRLSDAEVLTLLRFLRDTAVKVAPGSPAGPPRLNSDLQPWVLTDVMRDNDGEIRVDLANPNDVGPRGQSVILRRDGGSWKIVELRGR